MEAHMVEKVTNLSSVIDELLVKTYSYRDVGELFTRGLVKKRTDINAFSNHIPTHKLQRIRSETMRKLKVYFAGITSQKPHYLGTKLTIIRQVNENTLLGTINNILEGEGTEGLESIGKAVHEGSDEYVRKNPLAKTRNIAQFKEYKCILMYLQKLL